MMTQIEDGRLTLSGRPSLSTLDARSLDMMAQGVLTPGLFCSWIGQDPMS